MPDSAAETAVLDATGTYVVTMPQAYTIGGIQIPVPSASVAINPGFDTALVGQVLNNGTITLNATGANAGSRISLANGVSFSGTGSVVLNANSANLDTAYLYWLNGGADILTNGAGHTIRGSGNVYIQLANNGIVNANVANQTLRFTATGKSNAGTMKGSNGGTLLIDNVGVAQASGALISADGGSVVASGGGAVVSGGTITTANNGAFVLSGNGGVSGATLAGNVVIPGGTTGRISGAIQNSGTVRVNPTGANSGTQLAVNAGTTFSGNGSIVLNADQANLDTAYIYWINGGGDILTNAAGHSITGTGNIYVGTINNGLINADQNGKTLRLFAQPKTNNATMKASNNGTLLLEGAAFTQAQTAQTIADGGVVFINNASLTGGTLTSTNGGYTILNANSTLSQLSISGDQRVPAGTTARLNGAIASNAVVTVNPAAANVGTQLNSIDGTVLTGAGEIVLNANQANLDTAILYFVNGGGDTLTNGAGHTIRGTGSIYLRVVNNGTISADQNGKALRLTSQPKVNNSLMRAITSGSLVVEAPVTQSSTGEIVADGGIVTLTNGGTTVSGGKVRATNGGTVALQANATLAETLFDGAGIIPGGTLARFTGAITHNGTLTINPGGANTSTQIQCFPGTTIGGTGTIVLNANQANLDTAILYWVNGGGDTVTHGAEHTIRGTGSIYSPLTNNGTIVADVQAAALRLVSQPKANNAQIRATNGGQLRIENITVTQAGAGQTVADGGTVVLSGGGARITGGLVSSTNGGKVVMDGSSNLLDTTTAGVFEIPASTDARWSGTIVNNAVLTVNPTGANAGTTLRSIGVTTLSGTGSVVLNANSANLDTSIMYWTGGPADDRVINAPQHSIAGFGRIYQQLENRGILSPGTDASKVSLLEFRGALNCTASSQIRLDMAGVTDAQRDRITSTAPITLGGTLKLTLLNNFNPPEATLYTIISATSISGQFSTLDLPPRLGVKYNANSVQIFRPCAADVDDGTGTGTPDGGVGIDDLLYYLAIFQTGSAQADVDDGTFTGTADGGVTIEDLLYYLQRFANGC